MSKNGPRKTFFSICVDGRLREVQDALREAEAQGGDGQKKRLLDEEGTFCPEPIEFPDYYTTGKPLHAAASAGFEAVVLVLIEAGADHAAKDDQLGMTPLILAALHRHEVVVKALLAAGADPKEPDLQKQTPLHHAAYMKHGVVVTALLAAGADHTAKDKNGLTALHYAKDCEAVAKALLAAGADHAAKDETGRTPLHCAGSEAVAKALLAAGADLLAKDGEGAIPLHRVITQKKMEGTMKCINFLLQKHIEKGKENANETQEGLVYDSVLRACENAETLPLLKSNLLDFNNNQSITDSMNIIRLFAILIDSRRTTSFKFSDGEVSKINKVLADSLKQILTNELFHTPLATLAVLAGALGNRARVRVQVKDDLLTLRSKVIQLALAALSIPEMDEKDTALKALGYSIPTHISTGAFLTLETLSDKGAVKYDAPFVFLIEQRVTELIEVPQLQSSINAVFYKERSTLLPDDYVFWASMISEEDQKNEWAWIPSKQEHVKAEKLAIPDCSGKPLHFFFQALSDLEWKAQDWRTLPRFFFLSQFLFHCFYLALTVLVFWHSAEVSWSNKALGLMTLGYGAEEIHQLFSGNGFARYMNDPWNVIDIVFLFSFGFWFATGNDVWLAVNLFVVPFRLLHYFSIFQSAGVLVAVLIRMIAATCRFLVFYAVILFGFSAMMLALYENEDIDGFESFSSSTLSLFDASLGNYDFSIFWTEDKGYAWGGVASLIIFLLLSAVMALNLLIAILSEEYSLLADRAYSEWCYMFAQIVQENTVVTGSSFPGNLKLPPPLSIISLLAQSLVWMSNHLGKKSPGIAVGGHDTSASLSASDNGDLASLMETNNPVVDHVVPGQQPYGSPDDAAAQIHQATVVGSVVNSNCFLGLFIQVLHFAAIVMVASVDVIVHIVGGLPWALLTMYSISFKYLLGRADVPLYVLSLLSLDYAETRDTPNTWQMFKERYEGGFSKAKTKTRLLMLTGCFLWFLVGVPILSVVAYIWWIPIASMKGGERLVQEPGKEAQMENSGAFLKEIREALCSCPMTDDGHEFSQVLGEVADVKAEMAKAVGELKAQAEAQAVELKAMVARLLEAKGLAIPEQGDDETDDLASPAATAGAEEIKCSS